MPCGIEKDSDFFHSCSPNCKINILPIAIDEEGDVDRVGFYPTLYGKIAYYFPQETLWSVKGLHDRLEKRLQFDKMEITDNIYDIDKIKGIEVERKKISLNGFGLPTLIPVTKEAMENAISNLLHSYNTMMKIGYVFNDPEDIMSFIPWAIDYNYNRIHEKMANYPFRTLLTELISQHELLEYLFVREHTEMEKTDYSESSSLEQLVEHHTTRALVKTELHRSLQHLIEICVAECPNGSENFGFNDYQDLLAEGMLFNSLHFIKDIHSQYMFSNPTSKFEIVTTKMNLTPKFTSGNEWLRYNYNDMRDIHLMRNGKYKHYSPKISIPKRLINELNTVCLAEFDMSHNEFQYFMSKISTLPQHKELPFAIYNEKDLCNMLASDNVMSRKKIKHAIDMFSLKYRGKWNMVNNDKIEDIINIEDHYQEYSLYSHPIIKINGENDNDNQLIICLRCWCVFVEDFALAIEHGMYEAKSKAMMRWQSKYRNIDGKVFEMAVENCIRETTNFTVKRSVDTRQIAKDKTNSRNVDLGDIDVACADLENNILYSIECKSLGGIHEAKKMSSKLRYFSDTTKKNTPAFKHGERHRWLCTHRKEVKEYFGFSDEPEIISCYITLKMDPSSSDSGTTFPVISFSDLINKNFDCFQWLAENWRRQFMMNDWS